MWRRTVFSALVFLAASVLPASAYSVLTHEAIVDAVWDTSIAPLLRARYHASGAQLKEARSYAYGGCVIQDMGYYPLSSRMFGDLVHYVRSGDFIAALLRDARNADEYAFALGALAHFAADNIGHPVAINRAVPLLYPKLEAKYGDVMTYEDNPSAHLKTEFGFDVLQVARGGYLPEAYHDFIGFRVSKPLLERAFYETYGLELGDVFLSVDLAIGTFRKAVGGLIPEMTKVAWETKRDQIQKLSPGVEQAHFLFTLPPGAYEQEWGTDYAKPNLGQKILSLLFRLIPKIGPFRPLAFKPPTPEAEALFLRSFADTVARYRTLLTAARRRRVSLENTNFDTGKPIQPGAYRLVDEVYARLLEHLARDHFDHVPPALRANILRFYHDPDAPNSTRQNRKAWQKVQRELHDLTVRPSR